jgi:uncharacterized protein YjbI with pentapeptide repeats
LSKSLIHGILTLKHQMVGYGGMMANSGEQPPKQPDPKGAEAKPTVQPDADPGSITRKQILQYAGAGVLGLLIGSAGLDALKGNGDTNSGDQTAPDPATAAPAETPAAPADSSSSSPAADPASGHSSMSPEALAKADKTYAEADKTRAEARKIDKETFGKHIPKGIKQSPSGEIADAWIDRIEAGTELKRSQLLGRAVQRHDAAADVTAKVIANNAHNSWFWGNTDNIVKLGFLGTLIGGAVAWGAKTFNEQRADARQQEALRKQEASARKAENDKAFASIASRLGGPEEAWDNADVELLNLAQCTEKEHREYMTRVYNLATNVLKDRQPRTGAKRSLVPSTAMSNVIESFLTVLDDAREDAIGQRNSITGKVNKAPLLDASHVNLAGANLVAVNLYRMDFHGASFRYADLDLAVVELSNLADTDLVGASVDKTRFTANDGLKGQLTRLKKRGAIST